MEFNQRYNRNDFVGFLKNNFLPDDFVAKEDEVIPTTKNNYTTSVTKLGTCDSLDLVVYEIKHSSKHDARVGLSKEAFRILANEWNDKALVLFVPQDDSSNYRFSLITIDLDESENGKITKNYSNPRRYSYCFGEGLTGQRTPKEYLENKGRVKDDDDLTKRFDVEILTKQFYNDLFEWYQWALDVHSNVTFPNNTSIPDDDRENLDTKIIRLITRLMFVWFIKQKGLVPDEIFDKESLKRILKDFDFQSTTSGNYYNAILQNLFFATLNRAIEDENGERRGFAKAAQKDVKTLYRYNELFNISEDEVIELFSKVPFLNGGLFECLDKTKTLDGVDEPYNYDGFSRNDKTFADGRYKYRAFIPNMLFFDEEKGILSILKRYNFTIEENTPQDQQIALDPELLGRVFENLLGVYNPETEETARKSSGSFYTPRGIVNYMVDESLISYLGDTPIVRSLFSDSFQPDEIYWSEYQAISGKLKSIKILDPACGSGAFPMGLLNRIVDILKKIETEKSSYELKLKLIENCIYGVDIQSIAIQISKLRFFISLICDCQPDKSKLNFGIPTLPNLETKFVAANSLIGLKKQSGQQTLVNAEIPNKKEELGKIRHQHFMAKTPSEKRHLRNIDEQLRKELAELMGDDCFYSPDDVNQLISWNPYDQNEVSQFFDPEWMFGIKGGFDIVIGNPPYISTKGVKTEDKKKYEAEFGFSDDTYNLFSFKGIELLKNGGTLNYIIPKTFWTTQTKRNMRDLFLKNTVNYVYDTANPFDAAMVDTCIIQVLKNPLEREHLVRFLDGSKNLLSPIYYEPVKQQVYLDTQNSVIFKPTAENLNIWRKYGKIVKQLYDKWWDKIKTSRDIEKNKEELEAYRQSLKPGDVALLGCLTEGGVGLQTGNNGKYIAVRKSSKWAANIIESRPLKLAEAIKKKHLQIEQMNGFKNTTEFLNSLTEKQIAELFDNLKEKFGRDIFGQGYIYRLIDDDEIADVDSLTQDEKDNGIDISKKYYVPYDKGDKDGNRWYLETPFAIAWSKENVHFLKTNSGKKGEGMPVVRNPQFYFREGFCWNNVLTTHIKCRMKQATVQSTESMSLFSITKSVPEFYIITVINSHIIAYYVDSFVNSTSHCTTGDAKLIPLIIPTKEQINEIKKIFDKAIDLRLLNNDNKLETLQVVVDYYIAQLYSV
jgi:tRNA1(Val) A37 N6-methylase TrmN6